MTNQVGTFRTPEDAAEFRRRYHDIVETYWPDIVREELDIPTRFGTTHVRRSGNAEAIPVVMIHPTMGASLSLAPFAATLAERHPVYTPDTIGAAGLSVQTEPLTSGEDLAEWLDETLDGLSLDRVHLVGYSEGGFVACLAAALSPRRDRFVTVTLIEPGGAIGDLRKSTVVAIVWSGLRVMLSRDKRAAMKRIGEWLNGSDHQIPDDLTDLVLMSITKYRQRIPRPSKLPDDRLRGISAPVHLLLGEQSRLYDVSTITERTERLVPNLTTYIEPGGGHGFGFDQPERTMARVLAFIAEHEKTADRH